MAKNKIAKEGKKILNELKEDVQDAAEDLAHLAKKQTQKKKK